MSAILIIVVIVVATMVVLVAKDEKLLKENEKKRRALEENLLKLDPGNTWFEQTPSRAIETVGYGAYLIWLLHCENKYRDYWGEGENQYPPDWEWRRSFVILRDSGICQGCGAGQQRGVPQDCHHIKPISQFAPGEHGIHALTNLITLCPACHASQHPDNIQLQERANQMRLREFDHLPQMRRIEMAKSRPKQSSTKPIRAPKSIDFSVPSPKRSGSRLAANEQTEASGQDIAYETSEQPNPTIDEHETNISPSKKRARQAVQVYLNIPPEDRAEWLQSPSLDQPNQGHYPRLSAEEQEATIREFKKLSKYGQSAEPKSPAQEQPNTEPEPTASEQQSLDQIADEHQQMTLEQLRKRAKEDPDYEVPY
jgi:hypothetical protein